ncbi:MAG: TetR/AcrR family transcriptional regulator [Gemmobacter sp.]|nr:TetR/AcrR family transcriptional regulator [Gemmobacter sp.]
MARPATRRLPRDQRVAAILQTARVVLRERGFENFLTLEVAERCGVSEGTIYKYFASKRDLLIKVSEDWFDEFLDDDYAERTSGSLRERLFHVIWRSLSVVKREPVLTRFVLLDLRSDPNYRNLRIYEQNREIVARVTRVIQDGMTSGEIRSDIPLTLVRDMVFGGIEHQTWAYLRGEGDFSVEVSAEGLTDVLLRGIGAPVEAPPAPDALTQAVARLEAIADRLEPDQR